jgi:hypothetical protein
LEAEIRSIPNIAELAHQPKVYREEVGDRIVTFFEEMHLVPTLFFVDPWGYKGLSLRLVNSVLKDWGCDCIFFFNYNRINMGLANPYVTEHLDALFGVERGQRLRAQLESLSPDDREIAIVERLAEALRDMGGRYVLPFRFKNEHGTRTKHHLIFISKNVRGYEIMKDIMASESSKTEQGVASFEYNPADQRNPILFELTRPLDELEGMLQEEFAGQRLKMQEVYARHHIGRPYVKRNYKFALRHLEEEGKVVMRPAADKRIKRKGVVTVADEVEVIFR